MRTLSAALITELGLTVTRPGYLAQIDFNDTLSVYFSSFGDVTWNAKSWISRHLIVKLATQDGRASTSAEIEIGNDAQSMTAMILTNGISGRPMKIYKVYRGALAAGDAYLAFNGVCRSARLTPEVVTIPAGVEELGLVICPRRRINKSSGFNALIADGTRITIGNQIIVIQRRAR